MIDENFKRETRAEIIADSVAPNGCRLTTIEVTFHRFILAEVNTHRKLSRNSASSRAIPFDKMLERAMRFPAWPVKWPREQPGMSGGAELEGDDLADAKQLLVDIASATTRLLETYVEDHPGKVTRLHKSLLNRPLEWFMWHTAVLSSTEWENLLRQRDNADAQPEFAAVAHLIREALDESTPTEVEWGGIHVPYVGINADDDILLSQLGKIKVSTARCARVSYLTHDGIRDVLEDVRMFTETLWGKGHWSPMEHPAIATTGWPSGNFDKGWVQTRWFVENGLMADLERLLA